MKIMFNALSDEMSNKLKHRAQLARICFSDDGANFFNQLGQFTIIHMRCSSCVFYEQMFV